MPKKYRSNKHRSKRSLPFNRSKRADSSYANNHRSDHEDFTDIPEGYSRRATTPLGDAPEYTKNLDFDNAHREDFTDIPDGYSKRATSPLGDAPEYTKMDPAKYATHSRSNSRVPARRSSRDSKKFHPQQKSKRPAPFSRLFGHRPQKGTVRASLDVVDSVKELVAAEISLAKAEVAQIAKDKAMGSAAFIVAAFVALYMINALLFFIGAVLAIWLPVWAAAGIVFGLLLLIVLIAAFIGIRQMKKPASMENTKKQFDDSVDSASDAVGNVKTNFQRGTKEAVEEVKDTTVEALHRLPMIDSSEDRYENRDFR